MASVPSKATAEASLYQSIRSAIINDLNSNLASRQNVTALSPASLVKLMAEFKDPPRGSKLGWAVGTAKDSVTVVTGTNTTETRILTYIVIQ